MENKCTCGNWDDPECDYCVKTAEFSESSLNDLLCGRCATCKHWGGDGENVARILAETEFKENFLSIPNTWADCGECVELRVEMDFFEGGDCDWRGTPEPCGVFGCVLYKAK